MAGSYEDVAVILFYSSAVTTFTEKFGRNNEISHQVIVKDAVLFLEAKLLLSTNAVSYLLFTRASL